MGHHSPPQYNPADYVMDLVNQDMKVREELKEAYLQNRITVNQQVASIQLQEEQQYYSAEARKYLIAEPSGNEADLTNPDNINLVPTKHESKWPIGFLSQMLILLSRTFLMTGRRELTFLNCVQSLSLAVFCGLCWLRMDFTEDTISDRSSFIFFLMTFWPLRTMMHRAVHI